MNREPLSVVKLGGSLLDMPGVWTKLRNWLDALERRHILIVGGGATVDVIRQMDALHHLGEPKANELALHALSLNAHLAERLLARSLRAYDPAGCQLAWDKLQLSPVFDPELFVGNEEASPDYLPDSWDVTSDSIAARVARRLNATHLYLLKSCPISHFQTWEEFAAQGIVDKWFPNEARALSSTEIVLINFRDLP